VSRPVPAARPSVPPGRTPQRRIAETVASELREGILSGRTADRLPTQDQLVSDFGVSYPTVREALRILETEGLVTVRRGSVGGAEVHRPDQSSGAYHLGLLLQGAGVPLGDLAQGLVLLEPLCAGEVARRADRATAVGFTPNETMRYVVRSLVALWSAQEKQWAATRIRLGEYPSPAEARGAVRTHRRLVDEIAAGRAEEAQATARKHLAATQALVLARFNDDVVNATPARRGRVIGPS
jgi:GntR family transcriptional regulator, transcriptional repressor for pyruvate dehydrogenase complex